MNMTEYQRLAMRTANFAIYSSDMDAVVNAALGLCGEAGEFADILKKHLYQNSEEHPTPIDRTHLEKELGDILWYVALACEGLGTNISTIMEMNIEKLRKRYPDGFSADRSQHREKGDV